jgi:DNA-binding response OmpR family regulator
VEALTKAHEQPTLILLDANLSSMDGTTVYSRLKCDDATAHIPIILMIPEGKSPEDGLEIEADDYIVKPFELKDLRVKMELLLIKMPSSRNAMITEKTSD